MTVASPAAVPRLVVLDATNWGHMLWHASQGNCQLPLVALRTDGPFTADVL